MEYMYKGLVNKAKAGDKKAMETLIEKLYPLIYSAIGRYKGGRDKEDLFQDACILIIEAVRDYDETRGAPFLAFVKSRVYYGFLNLRKEDTSHLSLNQPFMENGGQSPIDLIEDGSQWAEELLIRDEVYKALGKALMALTEKQRQVVYAHFFQGKKLKDLAKSRDVHYKTVQRLKGRAIRELKNALKDLR